MIKKVRTRRSHSSSIFDLHLPFQFVEGKYRIALDNAAANHLNRAISSGNEKGTLYLPKGLSGKIKLAPKARIDTKKENAKPVLKKSAAVTKVSAAKKVPVVIPFATKKARGPTKAKTATVKRSPSKAATSEKPGKKITATTAKTASAKKPRTTTKKTTVAKGAAKKVITGEAKNLKKRKSATAARTGATAPSSKVKPALKVKSALKTAATKSAAKA
ncbi:hypothetical protein H0H81_010824 [Sphagnurus paluster]|uniref:Histone H1 n=1 Tax=Sphagnurus paluster TaxID=117069 RepID=A0A9P7G2H7_9AGAR|nr:hypothetical protein H0H81_010824 [Sphagnurus paluster]